MDLLGLVNRAWALRCLREAKTELKLAEEEQGFSKLFCLEAARKAQASIYHCLGDVRSIESLVFDLMVEGREPPDKISELLVAVERAVQAVAEADSRRKAYAIARRLVALADEVVRIVLGEGGGER